MEVKRKRQTIGQDARSDDQAQDYEFATLGRDPGQSTVYVVRSIGLDGMFYSLGKNQTTMVPIGKRLHGSERRLYYYSSVRTHNAKHELVRLRSSSIVVAKLCSVAHRCFTKRGKSVG
jgi:hypothetical protein